VAARSESTPLPLLISTWSPSISGEAAKLPSTTWVQRVSPVAGSTEKRDGPWAK
jgi:hypothetical protein